MSGSDVMRFRVMNTGTRKCKACGGHFSQWPYDHDRRCHVCPRCKTPVGV